LALVVVIFAIVSAPALITPTSVAYLSVTAVGAVKARHRQTIVDIHVTLIAFPSNVASTRIAVNCIGAVSVLTWLGVTLVDVFFAVFSRKPNFTSTLIDRDAIRTNRSIIAGARRAFVNVLSTVHAVPPSQTTTHVRVRTGISALAMLTGQKSQTLVDIRVAVFTAPPGRTGAFIRVDIVTARCPVFAWRRCTFVDAFRAVVSFPSSSTST